jgi:acyl-CoA synthetase (AMP-forming)/AMP-acid ligase II
MEILETLKDRWESIDYPFLVHSNGELFFRDLAKQESIDLSDIDSGEVVALIGDFNPLSIITLLHLIEKNAILVPLTAATRSQHEYFFESALVDVVIEGNSVRRIVHDRKHVSIEQLRKQGHAGLVLFSTGTTGRPKAILHDLTLFMQRFGTPRPTLKTIAFLLFDHVGGLNTLLHTLFNRGTVVVPKSRSVDDILECAALHGVEALPTTPTFLRMMLISGLIPDAVPKSLRIITYGTERMDQPTLDALCELLPDVEFRQTFGMSELGILRVTSEARDSLFMKVGGEGVETRVTDNVLEIRSQTRMLGYLNADSPFDSDGWYNTKDIVEERDGHYKVTGRTSEVINVGGLKFMASEVERVALDFDGVEFAKAEGKTNPITGEHVELTVQPVSNYDLDKTQLKKFLSEHLPNHMVPKRLVFSSIDIGHRFKRL